MKYEIVSASSLRVFFSGTLAVHAETPIHVLHRRMATCPYFCFLHDVLRWMGHGFSAAGNDCWSKR